MGEQRKKKNKKKTPGDEKNDNEAIIDYNPDDIESGEEVPGVREIEKKRKAKKEKKEHLTQDFNPDDYEEG
ncbi:MAG: hypothetical protein ACOC5A_00880 [Halanaerobiales bacterium]